MAATGKDCTEVGSGGQNGAVTGAGRKVNLDLGREFSGKIVHQIQVPLKFSSQFHTDLHYSVHSRPTKPPNVR